MREEHDSIGVISLPENAYYGVQSMRAKENFPMTGRLMHPYMIDALVLIKKAAAIANQRAGMLLILSGSMKNVSILGAYLPTSGRGSAMALAITSRIWALAP